MCKDTEEKISTKYLREQTDLGRLEGVAMGMRRDKTGQLVWNQDYSNRRRVIFMERTQALEFYHDLTLNPIAYWLCGLRHIT